LAYIAILNSLKNFLAYAVSYAGKSVYHPHFGLMERLRLFGVLMQLLVKSKYHPDKPVTQRAFGFTLHAPDPQLLLQLMTELFAEGIYYFDCNKAAPRIIDGGANIGLSVLYFKYLYPDAHILAIEPNPAAMVYLKKNISENKLTHIIVISGALAAEEGEGILYIPPSLSLLNASLIPPPHSETLKVRSQKLSAYLKGNPIDLVKLDIEGAEAEVIRETAEEGEIHNAKQYIIEYHPSAAFPEGLAYLKSIFLGIGYTPIDKHPHTEIKTTPYLLNFRYKSPKFRPVYQAR
jgi:FkbM family methyltransferase